MRLMIEGIGAVELSFDELDELVRRRGTSKPKPAPASEKVAESTNGEPVADIAILKLLVNAGKTGIPSQTVGEALHTSGKGIRKRTGDAMIRLGLGNIEDLPFENFKDGTKRLMRLVPKYRDAAAQILEGK